MFTIKYKPCSLSINRLNLITVTGGFKPSNTFTIYQLDNAVKELLLRKAEIKKALFIALARCK